MFTGEKSCEREKHAGETFTIPQVFSFSTDCRNDEEEQTVACDETGEQVSGEWKAPGLLQIFHLTQRQRFQSLELSGNVSKQGGKLMGGLIKVWEATGAENPTDPPGPEGKTKNNFTVPMYRKHTKQGGFRVLIVL